MNQNKTTKYFKYAIGEIVLVVIGILIALQINNWNINRVNSIKEVEYLTGIKNDLEKQITDLNRVIEFSNYILNQAESVLAEYSSKNSLNDIDSLNLKLSKLMYTRHFPDIRTTFNELNSTGQLSLIRNKELRSKIIKFYQNSSSSRFSIEGNIKDVFYPNVFPILNSSIIIQVKEFGYQPSKYNEDTFKQKMQNQLNQNSFKKPPTFEIINAISTRIIIENSNRTYLKNGLDEASLLLINVNTELEK